MDLVEFLSPIVLGSTPSFFFPKKNMTTDSSIDVATSTTIDSSHCDVSEGNSIYPTGNAGNTVNAKKDPNARAERKRFVEITYCNRSRYLKDVFGDVLDAERIRLFLRNILSDNNPLDVDVEKVLQQCLASVPSSINILDMLMYFAEQCGNMTCDDPDYGVFGGHIARYALQGQQDEQHYIKTVEKLFLNRINIGLNTEAAEDASTLMCPLIKEEFLLHVHNNVNKISSWFKKYTLKDLDFFGVKTLMKSYLLCCTGEKYPIETIEYMYARVALSIHMDSIERAEETYAMFVKGDAISSSPTLFNAGTPLGQLSSCFMHSIKEDSIEGHYSTIGANAKISATGGGIGLSISPVRAKGSIVRSSGGEAAGIPGLVPVIEATSRYIKQGTKRESPCALYVDVWHADIEYALNMRRTTGDEITKKVIAAVWVCDLFMKRVKENKEWSLFCPKACPGLLMLYGKEFEEYYESCCKQGKAVKTLPARDLMFHIVTCQIETSTPYILFKDAINHKTNHQNLGIVSLSNLCTEICQYSTTDEIACCNLGSISLPNFVNYDEKLGKNVLDYKRIGKTIRILTRNLNNVIDVTTYPVKEAMVSNLRHRPIGIGLNGLADVHVMLGQEYDSDEGIVTSTSILKCMYYNALAASCDLAKESGPYKTMLGSHSSTATANDSPISRGIFQQDMWKDEVPETVPEVDEMCNFDVLRPLIQQYGVRNSLLIALMPTATSAQIMGNSESFEPFPAINYVRDTSVGSHPRFNKYFVKTLKKEGLWTTDIREKIARSKTVQDIQEIPIHIRRLFRCGYEISSKKCIEKVAAMAHFIDQSMSFSPYIANPTARVITRNLFYAWEKGLKTGSYYIHARPVTQAQQFDLNIAREAKLKAEAAARSGLKNGKSNTPPSPKSYEVCRMEEGCLSCSS